MVPVLEKHHNVRILDEGLAAAVKLSHRYLPDRQLPDKAVSVLDTACARLALGQNTVPPAIEDATPHAGRYRRADARAGARSRARRRSQRTPGASCQRKRPRRKRAWPIWTRAMRRRLALVNQIRELRGKLEEAHAAGAVDSGSADAGQKLREELGQAECRAGCRCRARLR